MIRAWHTFDPTGIHIWCTPYILQISSVLSNGVGLFPFAITKICSAGKIFFAASKVAPIIDADL